MDFRYSQGEATNENLLTTLFFQVMSMPAVRDMGSRVEIERLRDVSLKLYGEFGS